MRGQGHFGGLQGDDTRFVAALLASMTWDEKLGQLRAVTLPPAADGQDFQDAAVIETLRNGRVGAVVSPRSYGEARHLQRIAVEESRLGVPLLFAGGLEEGDWPNPSAIAATWDESAIARLAGHRTREAALTGTNWLATPPFTPDESECDRRDAPRVLPQVLSDRIRLAMRRGIEHPAHYDPQPDTQRDPAVALPLMRSDDSCLAPTSPDDVDWGETFAGNDFSTWHGLDVESLSDLPALGSTAGPKAERDVNQAVHSLLLAKVRLGLFRDPFRLAYDPPARGDASEASMREIHTKSMILLANTDDVLPLAPDAGSVLAITAGHTRGRWLGDALDGAGIIHRRISGLALRQEATEDPRALLKADGLAIGIACDAASRADTVIVALSDADCIADSRFLPRPGPAAGALLGTLVNASRRCVLVSATSLPIDPTFLPVRLAAVLHAWEPTTTSEADFAQALGAILVGEISPSGRLPWPIGPAGDPQARPCGFGLAYGDIAYSRFTLEPGDGCVVASVTLNNTGFHDACETVQLYRRDSGAGDIDGNGNAVVSQLARLCDFARVELRAGECRRISFELGIDQLGQATAGARRQVAPGTHTIMVGRDSERVLCADIALSDDLARKMATPAALRDSVPFGDSRSA